MFYLLPYQFLLEFPEGKPPWTCLIYFLFIWTTYLLSPLYDDTKCFNNVSNTMDTVSLQQYLDYIAWLSIQSSLKFNTFKSVHLNFKLKIIAIFKLLDVPVATNTTHKDLGIILSVTCLRITTMNISAKKLLYVL